MKKCFFLIFCLLFIPASASFAGDQGMYYGGLESGAGVEHTFKSGVKGSDTEVSRTTYGVEASWSFLTLGYDHSRYSWDKPGDSDITDDGKDPFKSLHNVYLTADVIFPVKDDWYLNLAAGVNTSFEKEMSRSLGTSARAVLLRVFDSGWMVGVGAVGGYHPVRSIWIPAAGFAYGLPGQEGWTARIGMPRTMVRYGFSEDFAMQAGADYSSRIYRLENNSSAVERGYFRKRDIRLSMQAEWSPLEEMTLEFGPYYVLSRKWQFYDRHDSRIGTWDLDSAPGLQAGLTWRF